MEKNKDIQNCNKFFCIDMKIPFCAPSREILQLLHTFCYIIPGHPDKPGLHGKNAATQQLKPLEFAQCLLTGSLLQGNLLKGIDNCSGAARSVV